MFDTHVHLDYQPFYDDLDKVMARSLEGGVTGAVNPAVDLASSEKALDISRRHPHVLAACGIHPLYVKGCGALPERELETLLGAGGFAAVGEVGLDFWHGREDEGRQQEFFRFQASLAKRHGLVLLLHIRKAFYDVVKALDEERFDQAAVLHAWSGSWEMTEKALERGFYISVSANITRPGKEKMKAVLRRVPAERLLVETDAPDMPPWSKRGETHYPWELHHTVRALADTLGRDFDEVANLTHDNARKLFNKNRTGYLTGEE